MNPYALKVANFHRKFGQPIAEKPGINRGDLRSRLILEEAFETAQAIWRGDLVEAIDGMCDLLYVVHGTALEFGIDLDPFFAEVHRSNMKKEGGPSRADGKILKPEGWKPPRISDILNELTTGDPFFLPGQQKLPHTTESENGTGVEREGKEDAQELPEERRTDFDSGVGGVVLPVGRDGEQQTGEFVGAQQPSEAGQTQDGEAGCAGSLQVDGQGDDEAGPETHGEEIDEAEHHGGDTEEFGGDDFGKGW